MNILLVWPPSADYCILNEKFSCCEPLGLEYIAAPLLKEFTVDIADMRFEKSIEDLLKKKKYDVVGVAIPFTTSVNVCNRMLQQIKENDERVKVVIGGHYPTVTLDNIYLQYVDYAIIGEGVHSFYELVKAIENQTLIDDVKGIAIIEDQLVKYTDKIIFNTLDHYPIPARNLVSKYQNKYFHAHYTPVTLMRFSAGCPHNCTFCVLWKLTNREYIVRSNDLIIQELKGIDCENIYVVDDEAFINAPKMYELAQKIIEKNIRKRFHMYVRADTIINNAALFELWAKAGLDSVLIGLESIFDDELKGYKKNITSEMAHKCVEILHKNSIEIRANFIVKPEYSRENFQELKQTVFELDIDLPTFAVLTPFHGTDEYEKVKDQFIIDKLEFFDCYHTFLKTKLSLKDFYQEFSNLFRSAKLRDKREEHGTVFYAGKGQDFEEMTQKMENSYLYY
ncbi:B12-binding domain-containing radical SAM protein [Pelosinus fermentans]|uniref:Cobalamin B12-binding domain protein n=1 Tax=Pelosinus fermentans JBW45 TaxID=1192197 RepID=I9DGL1_9FIRM|nr:radical SAM protein [Pelosinus fermentans]AJQ26597.1 cobalamin B12-binding domain protein [Pelosinus fermentans JBW45]